MRLRRKKKSRTHLNEMLGEKSLSTAILVSGGCALGIGLTLLNFYNNRKRDEEIARLRYVEVSCWSFTCRYCSMSYFAWKKINKMP